MAENLLEMGPPSSKRPKLNSPALSASDGPGKGLPSTTCTRKHHHSRLFLYIRDRDLLKMVTRKPYCIKKIGFSFCSSGRVNNLPVVNLFQNFMVDI